MLLFAHRTGKTVASGRRLENAKTSGNSVQSRSKKVAGTRLVLMLASSLCKHAVVGPRVCWSCFRCGEVQWVDLFKTY